MLVNVTRVRCESPTAAETAVVPQPEVVTQFPVVLAVPVAEQVVKTVPLLLLNAAVVPVKLFEQSSKNLPVD